MVGAGPVGLFTALELKRRALSVLILDEQWRTAAHSYALALHPASLEILDASGVREDATEHGVQVDTVAFYDRSELRAEVRISELPRDFPYLLVLPQSDLEGVLERRLNGLGVKVAWNHLLDDIDDSGEFPRAVVQRLGKTSEGYAAAKTEWVFEKTYDWTAEFLVGADGHSSAVRRRIGLEFRPVAPERHFAVFEFEADFHLDREVRVVIADGTSNVLWPLPNGRFRFSFEMLNPEEAASPRVKARLPSQIARHAYVRLDRSRLQHLIETRAPWFNAEIDELRWSILVGFVPSLASSFGRGRVRLAGDSAHVAGPIGVLSMNVGLEEGRDLAHRIAAIQKGVAGLSTLDDYEAKRLDAWKPLLAEHGGLAAGKGADPWVRENARLIADSLPAAGEDRILLASQLGLEPA